MKTSVLDSKGQPVVLTTQEVARCNALQAQFRRDELHNALGFEINITTLTAISKSVIKQKFFEIPPAEYMPIRVGDNAWSTEITTYLDYQLAGDFETGIINTGANNSRLAEADAGVGSVTNPVINWAKGASWSMFDLKFAAKSGNWDLVTAKERSRKRNWDLGIQKIAFLGSNSNPQVMGLLTQSGVNSNTALITGYINALSPTGFATFVQGLINAFRVNCNHTAYPTHFVMPEADYNGLATPVNPAYPNISMLDYLLQAFKTITMNPNFKILPCAYADEAQNAAITGLNKNRYSLYRYDEDSYRMDIPVDYSNTLQNTINGFQFQNVGYGQFTGGLAYRPLEMLYFDFHV